MYVCKYMRYSFGDHGYVCEFKNQKDEYEELLEKRCSNIIPVQPHCPTDTKRDKDGRSICYIIEYNSK